MSLIKSRILGYAKELKEKNLRFIVLGTKDRLNPKLVSFLEQAERITEDCTGMTVSFCFNYGGEQEIADAAKIAAREGEITPKTIRKHLYHPEIPNLDMVVRTSGEERISGFMLWRSSYAEFMFIKKYFPDLSAKDIKKIIEEYNSRNRRFGK
jgi:undecaprenyl diphosphate synthase